jgi:hypothetical protein
MMTCRYKREWDHVHHDMATVTALDTTAGPLPAATAGPRLGPFKLFPDCAPPPTSESPPPIPPLKAG